jgi:hypothetical protein
MHQVLLMVLGLFSLLGLMGCQAPTAISTVAAAERPAQATIRLGGYRTFALVEAYTLQHVDHLRLRLLKANAQGAYVATGVTRVVAPADLASPVSLGNLKLGQAYRVQADAFADAAETVLISAPSASTTNFTMPGLATVGGIASVDDTPVSLALGVRLIDKTYAGTGSFSVVVSNNLRNKADSLRVSLYQVNGGAFSLKFQKTVAWAGGPTSFTMTNLKHGTSYRLVAEAFEAGVKVSTDASSTAAFAVPAVAVGAIDDDVNTLVGALTVPCSR